MKLAQKLKEFFSLDYRSLALMRFSAGLLIIIDLVQRAHSLTAQYTDAGVLPRATLLTLADNKFFISLHMISGLGIVEAALFIAAGVFALMLMVGYRTRLAIVASWFLLISLHTRNPLVLQGGDVVFRVILFWMMFLPLGKRWSLDRLLNRTAPAKKAAIFSAAAVAYVVQIVLVYVMSGLLKTGLAWHDGTAVYYALSIDQLVRPFGSWLLTKEGLTRFFTYATVKLELFGSLLFFSPVVTGLIRTIGILVFAIFQIGLNLSFHVGLFGPIMIMATLGMLPPYFWDVWWARATAYVGRRARPGLSIYYDVNCGFCYKMVYVLKNFLLLSPQTNIVPANVDPAISQLMEEKNSWVIIDGSTPLTTGVSTELTTGAAGNTSFGFRGLAKVASYSPLFFWLSYIFLLPGIRDLGEYCYRLTAEKRLLVCLPEKEDARPTGALATTGRFLGSAIIIFLMIYVIAWNFDPNDTSVILKGNEWIGWTLRLDQSFDMFAPTPLTQDGWYVIPATLENGQSVDIFKDGPMLTGTKLFPVSYAQPKDIADMYPDQRWQKYLMNLAEADNSQYRLAYGQYLCRTWNAKHSGGETLETFQMTFMMKTTPPPGAPQTPAVPTDLWTHYCFSLPSTSTSTTS